MDTIGRSLADGWWMFWETLWALVLGFGLSGAVQAFVSRAEMQHALGDHTPRTVAKAGFFGMVSSSCSYAAAALAKTLFGRGADFTATQAFMFASTNLVVELGIVLWLLIGWQFALAEFVGGTIMILLLWQVLPRVVSPAEADIARDTLNAGEAHAGGHEHHGEQDPALTAKPWPQRVRSLAGWSDAAGYTISDLTMLRKELVIGFVIAGFADVAVPTSFWRSLFITGHGFWSALENVVLGPFLAIISFVCSIGNVPLAAALWSGGISFGGVVSFVFADLITLPLLLIYRKYYGTRLTAKLLAVFWATMSVAGLATEYLFKAVHIPAPAAMKHGMIGRDVWGLNYTTVLDFIALAAFAVLYWLYRNRERFGGGAAYAKDPVCGMQVEKAHPGATTRDDGRTVYFCSDHCRHKYDANPGRYTDRTGADLTNDDGHDKQHRQAGEAQQTVDPVCGMTVDPATAAAAGSYASREFFFCNPGCAQRFHVRALDYLTDAPDPVCGMTVHVADSHWRADVDGTSYVFCGQGCRDRFVADPAAHLASADR